MPDMNNILITFFGVIVDTKSAKSAYFIGISYIKSILLVNLF